MRSIIPPLFFNFAITTSPSLTGRDDNGYKRAPKARPWSASHAFYARTRLIKKIFEMADASGAFTEKLAA
jgi:hypothetical protein